MGLGPPVCMRCRVLYQYQHSYGWECPICKLDDQKQGLWECDIDQQELENNLKFFRFVNGNKV